jgi:hypothetical protein
VAYYARLLMLNHPELDGLFELRPSVADDWARTRLLQRQRENAVLQAIAKYKSVPPTL